MVYIKGLNIKAFRGISNLEINDFSDINIITGANNCGKTTLLEIIKGSSLPVEISNWASVVRKREGVFFGISIYDPLLGMFNVNNIEKNIEFTFNDENNIDNEVSIAAEEHIEIMTTKEVETLRNITNGVIRDFMIDDDVADKVIEVRCMDLFFKYKNSNGIAYDNQDIVYDFSRRLAPKEESKLTLHKTIFVTPYEHAYNSLYLKEVLENSDLYAEMLKVLKDFDEDIININSYAEKRETIYTITSKKNKRAIPLNLYGDGMKKVLVLMSAIIKAKDGILLLDEFETAIHTSALNSVFNWVIKTCKRLNVQLFVTTHSDEAISKLLNCAKEELKNIRVITLYKKERETVSRVLTGEKALEVKNNFGLELR